MNTGNLQAILIAFAGLAVLWLAFKQFTRSDSEKQDLKKTAVTNANVGAGMLFLDVGLGLVSWLFVGDWILAQVRALLGA